MEKLTDEERELLQKGGYGDGIFVGSIIGKYSGRPFWIEKAGGEILELSWENAQIVQDGIDIVIKHTNRFGKSVANEKMIERLTKILNREIPVTDYDLRFYTHEMREYERYKALGFEDMLHKDIPNYEDVWNNTHSATLEDFKLKDFLDDDRTDYTFYHPDIKFEDF